MGSEMVDNTSDALDLAIEKPELQLRPQPYLEAFLVKESDHSGLAFPLLQLRPCLPQCMALCALQIGHKWTVVLVNNWHPYTKIVHRMVAKWLMWQASDP